MNGKMGYKYYRKEEDSASAIYKTRDDMDYLELVYIERDLGSPFGDGGIPFGSLDCDEQELMEGVEDTWADTLDKDETSMSNATEISENDVFLLKL